MTSQRLITLNAIIAKALNDIFFLVELAFIFKYVAPLVPTSENSIFVDLEVSVLTQVNVDK